MKYRIKDEDVIFDTYDEAIDWCIDEDYHWDEEYDFRDWVNDLYDGIEICGNYFAAYDILDSLADGMLRDLHRDYCNDRNENDKDEADYQLERAVVGDEIECQGYVILVIEDEPGDYDGDEMLDAINALRATLNAKKEEEKPEIENDLMQMFQTIGD